MKKVCVTPTPCLHCDRDRACTKMRACACWWRWYVRSWRKLRRLYEMDSVGPREGPPAAVGGESV